jgi:hypothetical protein
MRRARAARVPTGRRLFLLLLHGTFVEAGAALADALGVESEEPEESCETTVQAPKPAVDFTD